MGARRPRRYRPLVPRRKRPDDRLRKRCARARGERRHAFGQHGLLHPEHHLLAHEPARRWSRRRHAVARAASEAEVYSGSAAAASRARSTSGCTKKNEPIVTTTAAPTAVSSNQSRGGEPPATTTPPGSGSPWRMKSARTMLR